MDFAPEPVLDAFTPPPTRQAPRTAAPDDTGRTFDDHLDAVNEPPAERPAPMQNEAKEESAPAPQAKQTPDAEVASDEDAPNPDAALLGGPLPAPAPPPMAAPVIVQIAASQPAQQDASSQDAAADAAPLTAPEMAVPPAPDTEAALAAPASPAATGEAKRGEAEAKPAAPEAPQQPAQTQQSAQNTQPAAQQQPPAPPATTGAQIEVQQLPPEVQQAIAQTIAPAPQAVAQPTARTTAKPSTQPVEATTEPDAREAQPDAPAANAKSQQAKAPAAGAIAIDAPAAPVAQSASVAPDASQIAQGNAIMTTASQASTHVQQAAVDTGAQRAAPAAAQVSREIIRRFDGGNTSFELRLDPAELGRVEVKMEVTRDHRVTAVITADNPQALTELARHARELEQQLQSAGLQLSDSGLSFDLRQGGNGGEAENTNSSAHGASSDEALTEQHTAPLARPIGYERWRGVRVDMMV